MYNHGRFALLCFPGGSVAKITPAVQGAGDSRVQSLGGEIPWRRGVAHSSILALRLPWAEEPGGLRSSSQKRSDTTGLTAHMEETKTTL